MTGVASDAVAPSGRPATPPRARQALDLIAPLAFGTMLAGYRIGHVIGQGGFGIVYDAIATQSGQNVAIKEYMPVQLAARPAGEIVLPLTNGASDAYELGRQAFLDEAALLGRFRHAGLVHALDCWEQNGTAYMAMPRYDGITLEQIIASDRQRIDEHWLKTILVPVLDALEVLHADRCLHRDVSPDNLLIAPDDTALLLDLGAARRVIGEHARALTVMLKSGFAPIEQYADDPVFVAGPWTDIYALGSVLHYAITGEVPPASTSRMMSDRLVCLSERRPGGYSAAFLAAIDAGMALRPEDRPRSIAAFRQMLFAETQAVTRSETIHVVGDVIGRNALAANLPGLLPTRRSRHGVQLVVAMALAAFVAANWWAGHSSGEPPAAASARVLTPTPSLAASVMTGSASTTVAVAGQSNDAIVATAAAQNVATRIPLESAEVDRAAVQRDASVAKAANVAPTEASAVEARPKRPAAPARATGTLQLSVQPWAEVYVDGQRKGVSPPLSSLALATGRRRIELRNSGAASATYTVDVLAGQTASIQHRFP